MGEGGGCAQEVAGLRVGEGVEGPAWDGRSDPRRCDSRKGEGQEELDEAEAFMREALYAEGAGEGTAQQKTG